MLPSTPTIKMAALLDDDDLSIDEISLLEGELDESTELSDEEVELNIEPVACEADSGVNTSILCQVFNKLHSLPEYKGRSSNCKKVFATLEVIKMVYKVISHLLLLLDMQTNCLTH